MIFAKEEVMKKLIFIALLSGLFCLSAYSQVIVNDVDINKEDIKYCQLLAEGKLLSKKVSIIVDYGQLQKLLGKKQVIKDASGKKMELHSVIDALNFMDKNGWEYVNSYAITTGGDNVYHYLLKKRD